MAIKKYPLVVLGLACLLGLAGISIYEFRVSSTGKEANKNSQLKPTSKQSNGKSTVITGGGTFSPDAEDFGQEITLEEAVNIKGVKTLVPKYLPDGAKLDIVRVNRSSPIKDNVSVVQHYTMGDDWFYITAITRPEQPDYSEKAKQPISSGTRYRADRTTETVPMKTNGIRYKTLADGTQEPVPVSSPAEALTVDGMACRYGETLDKGFDNFVQDNGRVPRMVSTRGKDFRSVMFWRDGTEYYIGAFNLTKGELVKIMKSMLQ